MAASRPSILSTDGTSESLYALDPSLKKMIGLFLSRSLFSFVRYNKDGQGSYKHQIIHFGASFKQLEEEWEVWLMKFEGLLRRMYWDKVYLHLHHRYGSYDYIWKAAIPDFDPALLHPVERWTFSGGPRQSWK